MSCSTDIVTCLRSNGIEPHTYASNTLDSTKRPSTVFNYSANSSVYYFHAKTNDFKNWWFADFQRIVYIHAYNLTENMECNWVSEYTINVSIDKKEWLVIDSKNNYSNNSIIPLKKIYLVRYMNITGSAGETCPDPTVLPFKRLYLYGALSLKTFTCKAEIIHLKLFSFTAIYLYIY